MDSLGGLSGDDVGSSVAVSDASSSSPQSSVLPLSALARARYGDNLDVLQEPPLVKKATAEPDSFAAIGAIPEHVAALRREMTRNDDDLVAAGISPMPQGHRSRARVNQTLRGQRGQARGRGAAAGRGRPVDDADEARRTRVEYRMNFFRDERVRKALDKRDQKAASARKKTSDKSSSAKATGSANTGYRTRSAVKDDSEEPSDVPARSLRRTSSTVSAASTKSARGTSAPASRSASRASAKDGSFGPPRDGAWGVVATRGAQLSSLAKRTRASPSSSQPTGTSTRRRESAAADPTPKATRTLSAGGVPTTKPAAENAGSPQQPPSQRATAGSPKRRQVDHFEDLLAENMATSASWVTSHGGRFV